MNREEWLTRSFELAPRGNELPQAKLTPESVRMIRRLREERERIRDWVNENYSDKALARRFGVSANSIYRAGNWIDWGHVR